MTRDKRQKRRFNCLFKNEYLSLSVHTGSKRFYELVENVLDFGPATGRARRRISVQAYIEQSRPQGATAHGRLKYERWLEKEGTVLFNLNRGIAETRADLRKRIIRSSISGYEEAPKENILDFTLLEPLRAILARYGMFYVHASMVSRDDSCVLFIGPQGCGKTTLALNLALNGFGLPSDDDCYIKLAGGKVRTFPFPTKMGLGEGLLKMHPALMRRTSAFTYGGKRRISLSAVRRPDTRPYYICKALVFPRYSPRGRMTFRRISTEEAVRLLAANHRSVYPEEETKDMLWTLYALARKTDHFGLSYNDKALDAVPPLIRKIL